MITAPGEDLDIESYLVDLGTISLPLLRTLNGAEFRRARRHVLEQTTGPQLATKGGSCSRQGFD